LDRANRFEQFLLSSGYVFLGDYEDGPFQFSARNQYIRYDNQYYRLNAATDVGFTTTGTDATSFANDVTHFVLMDGDTLRQNLGSSESDLGGALVNIGQATVRDVVRANILSYMSKTDQLAIKGVVGTEVVVDYALRAAINDGVTIMECPPVPGIYVFGQSVVTLPAGFSFEGGSRRTYTISSDASFNNAGTVFRLFNGASAIFKLTSRHTFRRVIFDGRNKLVRFMQGDDQTQWCRFFDCGVHRWYIGIGGSSTNGYSATLIFSGGTISSNTIGVKNVIDSLFLGATINANDTDGVQLLTGANNNAFIGVRNEWNNGDNYYGYGCKRILIQGELIDRAGKRAVAAVGGAQFTLSGVAVQRSGRLATEGAAEDAHYYIEGEGSSIIETAVHTTMGANDDGSGRQSPTYILATGGSSSDGKSFQASASNLSGYTGSSWLRSGLVKTLSVLGCSGVEDVKNFGLRRISDGVQYLGDAVSALSLSGAGNTATLTFKTTAQAFSRYSSELLVRNLEIRARNNTSTGSVAYYSVNLIISREQAAAAIAVDTASVRTFATLSGGTWGITSASPTGVSLSFAVSEDGTTLTVTLTAIDSASRIINARLRA
ncbi:phage tail fiber protein, partial [Klebsiella pneumoniae]|nr:phage tail fiber protein [Klebsiella pneumoniae]MCP5914165.1 phage tail fiber protein [Klebsiella pneumoniae]MCP5976534.1 phage tail fiber protein [Klebsiella pneumoniae]MCP6046857.1 phage tail fiber protein [Klebsiella pneumoniae]MCP6196945.1 phage tail fiber protein [Klebsiella pneumoniae]